MVVYSGFLIGFFTVLLSSSFTSLFFVLNNVTNIPLKEQFNFYFLISTLSVFVFIFIALAGYEEEIKNVIHLLSSVPVNVPTMIGGFSLLLASIFASLAAAAIGPAIAVAHVIVITFTIISGYNSIVSLSEKEHSTPRAVLCAVFQVFIAAAALLLLEILHITASTVGFRKCATTVNTQSESLISVLPVLPKNYGSSAPTGRKAQSASSAIGLSTPVLGSVEEQAENLLISYTRSLAFSVLASIAFSTTFFFLDHASARRHSSRLCLLAARDTLLGTFVGSAIPWIIYTLLFIICAIRCSFSPSEIFWQTICSLVPICRVEKIVLSSIFQLSMLVSAVYLFFALSSTSVGPIGTYLVVFILAVVPVILSFALGIWFTTEIKPQYPYSYLFMFGVIAAMMLCGTLLDLSVVFSERG